MNDTDKAAMSGFRLASCHFSPSRTRNSISPDSETACLHSVGAALVDCQGECPIHPENWLLARWLPSTWVTGLAPVMVVGRTAWCSPATRGRIAGFPLRGRRRASSP